MIGQDCYRTLRQMIEKPKVEDNSASRIFDTAVKELISDSQLSIDELTAEAVVLLFAGGEATAISVIIGTFHLLSDHERLHILRQELLSAMPDGQSLALSELEKLPYLVSYPEDVSPSNARTAHSVGRRAELSKRHSDLPRAPQAVFPGWPLQMESLCAANLSQDRYDLLVPISTVRNCLIHHGRQSYLPATTSITSTPRFSRIHLHSSQNVG